MVLLGERLEDRLLRVLFALGAHKVLAGRIAARAQVSPSQVRSSQLKSSHLAGRVAARVRRRHEVEVVGCRRAGEGGVVLVEERKLLRELDVDGHLLRAELVDGLEVRGAIDQPATLVGRRELLSLIHI